MLLLSQAQTQDRIKSAIAAGLFHALLGYAFIAGLGIDVAGAVDERLKIFDVAVPPIPPPVKEAMPAKEKTKAPAPRRKPAPKDPEGAAAPPNLKSRPTEIVAPKPEVRLPVPPPVIAAPIAGPGAAAMSGNASVKGPGTGAGGVGTGTGSGRYGNGGGGGGGAGPAVQARWRSGSLRVSDYPRSALDAGIGGTVYIRFVVKPNGRIGDCRVTRSSGNAALDQTTCRLIQRRFRYWPARDEWGRRIADVVNGEHVWEVDVAPDRWEEATVPEDEGY